NDPVAAIVLDMASSLDRTDLPRPRFAMLSWLQELGLVIVILLLCITLSIFGSFSASRYANAFLNFDNLFNGVATPMSIFAIMAVGMTFVIITGGIDISIGSIFALSALGGAWVLQTIWPLEAGAAQP